MLTIFTIPKAFEGHINIIQRNAIQSWLKLSPKCEIMLFGNDKGAAETAAEFGIRHIPEIEKNEFDTPLLDSAFNLAQKLAKNNLLVYINTDIILISDFIPAIKRIVLPLFLMAGRRWDLDIKEEINFDEVGWEERLQNQITQKGKLHGFAGIDYFVFPSGLPHSLPSFAVGRPGWDSWLIYRVRSLRIPVVDATKTVTIIHQIHDYSHSQWGKKHKVEGPEAKRNFELAKGFSYMLTLRDADWILDRDGLKRPGFPRRIFPALSLFPPWRMMLSVKRKLQQL